MNISMIYHLSPEHGPANPLHILPSQKAPLVRLYHNRSARLGELLTFGRLNLDI